MEKIRLGIAGCGWISQNVHSVIVTSLEQVEIVSIYDVNETVLEKWDDKLGGLTKYTNYNDFLKSIDAVLIATPNYTHYILTKQALEAKKHVLCEKPVTTSVKEL